MKPGDAVRIEPSGRLGIIVKPSRKRWAVGYTVDVLVDGRVESVLVERVTVIEKEC